jgi:hypothetical protein
VQLDVVETAERPHPGEYKRGAGRTHPWQGAEKSRFRNARRKDTSSAPCYRAAGGSSPFTYLPYQDSHRS